MTTQAKALSRKAQGEETRGILLNTGARLFALNGYNGVSMRTLASAAGVNLATVSYHFGGKAGLYEAILQQVIDMRDEIFPTADEVQEWFSGTEDDIHAQAEGVSWFVNKLVHGLLGDQENIWPALIISRELALPSDIYPKLEKEFFDPSFLSLHTLVKTVTPDDTDNEELIISAHCIITMVVKFLEGFTVITKRLDWENYEGHGVDKIAAVLSKRIRGFLGLPMENV
ncbi:MAG: CerR family C-terminal domain-containing protein [Pseudodesulfovibrio sp.]